MYADRFILVIPPTHYGIAYITEVERCLVYIRESEVLSIEEKRRFFKSANKHMGISALCLSGGAGFGYCAYLLFASIGSFSHHRGIRRDELCEVGFLNRSIKP